MATKVHFRLKVMADYDCFPVWDAGPSGPRSIDPRSLPISQSLIAELGRWEEKYNKTLNKDDPRASIFSTPQEHAQFVEEGRRLAKRLGEELGPDSSILYFDDLTGVLESVGSSR